MALPPQLLLPQASSIATLSIFYIHFPFLSRVQTFFQLIVNIAGSYRSELFFCFSSLCLLCFFFHVRFYTLFNLILYLWHLNSFYSLIFSSHPLLSRFPPLHLILNPRCVYRSELFFGFLHCAFFLMFLFSCPILYPFQSRFFISAS